MRAGGGGERQQAQGAEVSTHLGSCEKQDPVRVVSLLHIAIVSTDLFVLRTSPFMEQKYTKFRQKIFVVTASHSVPMAPSLIRIQ